MPTATSPTVRRRRPASVPTTVGVLVFLGITAIGGGFALVAGATPPDEWLSGIPLVDAWIIPGLVLAIGFGAGSLLVAYGVVRRPRWPWLAFAERLTRHHWSWIATILIGAGHIAWIALELVYLPALSALQIVYGAVGVALVLLPLLPSFRGYLRTGA